MLTVLLISAALIAFISFDSSWSNVLLSSRNDLVFTDRNHNYGAYALRKEYHRNLFVSLLASTLLMGGICTAMFLSSAGLNVPIPPPEPVEVMALNEVPDLPVERQSEEQVRETAPPARRDRSVEDRTVEIVEEGITSPVLPVEEPRQAGTGTGGTTNTQPTGEGVVQNSLPAPAFEPWVQELPQFPGGDAALMKYLENNIEYTPREVRAGIQGTIWVTFVVRKNGEIDEVKVERGIRGGEALERKCMEAVQRMPNWIPGKTNDQPVAYKHRIPIRFEIRTH